MFLKDNSNSNVVVCKNLKQLDRGKCDADFLFKLCKKRCIKYKSKFTNFTQIKHALFAVMAFNKLFILKQSIVI